MDYEKEYRLSGDGGFDGDPIPVNGFELLLKAYIDDDGEKKRYCVLRLNTHEGTSSFIMIPEEIHKLADTCNQLIDGVDLREEFMPKIEIEKKK